MNTCTFGSFTCECPARRLEQTMHTYQCGLASALHTIQTQEERRRKLVSVLGPMCFEVLQYERNAVLRLVVNDLRHADVVCLLRR